jgi:hypothetical protein
MNEEELKEEMERINRSLKRLANILTNDEAFNEVPSLLELELWALQLKQDKARLIKEIELRDKVIATLREVQYK